LAFTGNKFEFRMLGSADSISCTNVIMNTTFAQVICEFADELESAVAKGDDFKKTLKALLKRTITNHKRVIFNGNGYSDEWLAEAEKRGLPNYVSTVDALPHYTDDKYVAMFEKFRVYTRTEIASRMEILLENYSKVLNIEANTMLYMAKKQIAPAALEYTKFACDAVISKKNAGLDSALEEIIANKLSMLTSSLYSAIETLDADRIASKDHTETAETLARYYRDVVFADMQNLRAVADELEMNIPESHWPIPTYIDLLFTV
ncbi:MAG: glutamine synthetase type III, partial [Oscillospiraceae bacterium]|nr:glutamine synthetase type III [Oscillospiraceae bacterium]